MSKDVFVWSDRAKADSGEALMVLGWKQTEAMTKAGKKAFTKRYLSVPFLDVDAGRWTEFVRAELSRFQKVSIQSYVESELSEFGDSKNVVSVPDDYFSPSSLYDLWEDQELGAPSEDEIEQWFRELLEEKALAHIIKALGIGEKSNEEEQEKAFKRASQICNGYLAGYKILVSGKEISLDDAELLLSAANSYAEGTRIQRSVLSKVKRKRENKSAKLSMALA